MNEKSVPSNPTVGTMRLLFLICRAQTLNPKQAAAGIRKVLSEGRVTHSELTLRSRTTRRARRGA